MDFRSGEVDFELPRPSECVSGHAHTLRGVTTGELIIKPPHDKSPTVIFWRLLKNNKTHPPLFHAKRAKIFELFGLLKGISLLNSASFENNKTHPPLFQIPKLKKEIPHSKISRIWGFIINSPVSLTVE